jgi:transposase-like protein
MSGSDKRLKLDGVQRGCPGRHNFQDHHSAVVGKLQGKATVDQVARRLGVRAETVFGGRDAALAGMEPVLLRGDGPTTRERDLEMENNTLRDALTSGGMRVELLQRPFFERWGASPPGALLRAVAALQPVAR